MTVLKCFGGGLIDRVAYALKISPLIDDRRGYPLADIFEGDGSWVYLPLWYLIDFSARYSLENRR